ncbi:hypothetical protein [Dyella japonica]|uniref:Uncharacterized protein n=1 Tax=Dyella japonica DSM 16301 TaxID=1440762 RepID=A0A0G9H6I5_9GAMM|nr:hypothetical protein [Dyella japonica]KLD65450.1 hypothetical protein Y882_02730 [Dyella japonica DSM 16301]
MSTPGDLQVALSIDITLDVMSHATDRMSIALYQRTHDGQERKLIHAAFAPHEAQVDPSLDMIWFGEACVALPWPDLLKVADFLRLDIPQTVLPATAGGSLCPMTAVAGASLASAA